ncbi:MAG: hypothetical protein AABX23_04770 [Nanoarchaeota archaeon]
MKENKENDWKNVFWIALVVILLFVIGFGVKIGTYERTDTNTPTINYGAENQYNGQTQTVSISGIGEVKTVNNANVVNLLVSGTDNEVTVTKNTKISSLSLSGIDNIINLCNGVHNPEVMQSGIGNKVNYLNC